MTGGIAPTDPRPATADPVGTRKRVIADNGTVEIWEIIEIIDEKKERKRTVKRIAQLITELDGLLEEEDMEAQLAEDLARATIAHRRESIEREIEDLRERLG